VHWADFQASRLAERSPDHIIATGITPSGEFHIGHLRESLTGEMLTRAACDAGLSAEMIFIVDSADPLRRVYKFLSEDYSQYIGHPLGSIPAPNLDGSPNHDGETYAAHFLNPFIEALRQIGVRPRIVDNYQSYKQGRFNDAIKIFIEKRHEVREIIERVSGRELAEDWFPFSPVGADGGMDGVIVTSHEWPLIHWRDGNGVAGTHDLSQLGKFYGKLPWRLDWPARWAWNGISCEPFGKDHGTAGGSYDTGKEIVALLGYDAPVPLTYEWIQLKGMGAMSSSAGIAIGPLEALELVPPQILRFLIARNKPNRHIDFDTGDALISLADIYERQFARIMEEGELPPEEMKRRKKIAWEVDRAQIRFSQVEPVSSLFSAEGVGGDGYGASSVTFRYLVMLAQVRGSDDEVWSSLHKSGHMESITPSVQQAVRLKKIRSWLASEHFPESFRLVVQKEITPDAQFALSELARDAQVGTYLHNTHSSLAKCDWDVTSINNAICEPAKELEIGLSDAFAAMYWMFLGKNKGPKLASILVMLSRNEVLQLIANAKSII